MNKSAFICVILCGVLVACLPRLVAPSDSYISDSLNPVVTDNTFDLFPPFQPVYLDTSNTSNFQFVVSVPLNAIAYDFVWSYSSSGRSFIPASIPSSVFIPSRNFITLKSDRFSDLYLDCAFYIRCRVYESGTSNLLHTYYFSYQFFDFPLSQNNSSKSALKAVNSIDLLQEEQPQEEPKEIEPQEEQPQEEPKEIEPQEEQPQEEPKEIEPQEEQPQEEIEGGVDYE